jgi:hypothetical protein
MNQTSIIPNWCRLALLAVALAVVALLWARHHFGRAEYERRIAALQAAGEPVTTSDFAARYPDPPPERQFRRLLRSVLPAGSNPAVAPPNGDVWEVWGRVGALSNREPFAPELLEQARLELVASAATVELLLRTDLADFGLLHQWQTGGWTNSSWPDGDDISLRMKLCVALALQAAYEAEVGHPQRAATALVRGYQIARLPSHIGVLSAFGQLGCEHSMLPAVERTLNRAVLTDDDLRRLAEVLPRPSDLMREAMFAERARLLFCWNDSATWRVPKVKDPWWKRNGTTLGHPKLDQIRCLWRGYGGRLEFLDRWADRVAATRLPMREQLAAIATNQSKVFQIWASQTNFASRVQKCWDVDYSLLLCPEAKLTRMFDGNARQLAGLANAQAAVAIERWRLAHPGRLPDTLSELVPAYLTAVPLDPFDGQPVRYKKLPVGYVVYSVGLGWTDQGERSGSAIKLAVER